MGGCASFCCPGLWMMDTLAEEDKESEKEGDNRQLTAKHLD